MVLDTMQELLRLADSTPPDAPLRRAWLAGRLRQEMPDDALLAAAALWASAMTYPPDCGGSALTGRVGGGP